MSRKILLVNGHPDPSASRLAYALSDAYARGAAQGGHTVRRIDVGSLRFPMLITGSEINGPPVEDIRLAQESILWADHIVVVFPLWLSSPPAVLKGFFENICSYGFSFDAQTAKGLLGGRSARLIVTMIVPQLVFQLIFRSGVRAFDRGVFWASGIKPIKTLALSSVLTADKTRWFQKLEALGKRGL